MSWIVGASGTPSRVREQLSEQFKIPLAEKPAGLSDDGERETVQRIAEMIEQCLETFGPENRVSVNAGGHRGFADWDKKTGGYQSMSITIVLKSLYAINI